VTDLSPAAQAVRDAAFDLWETVDTAEAIAAAALRAAADQVVPVEPEPPELPFPSVNDPWPRWNANQNTRQRILAIAAELQAKALPGPVLRNPSCDKTSRSVHR